MLIFIGFSMLQGANSPSTPEHLEDQNKGPVGIDRLVLFAASPGTIAGVITIVAAHGEARIPVTAIIAIAVVLVATWALLIAATMRKTAAPRRSLSRDMISRYMGLVVIAMGIQFALSGYKGFMAG